MIQPLYRILNKITMYKLLVGGLSFLAGLTLLLRYLNVFNYASFGTLGLMFLVAVGVSYGANALFAKLYGVAVNHESSAISGLIVFFILTAPSDAKTWLGIAFAAVIAMASKYIITQRGALIFNPAAFGVLAVELIGIGGGSWWIANTALFVPFLIFGLLILIKLQRFSMFLAFTVPAVVMIVARTTGAELSLTQALVAAVTLYPIVFLGTVMLTEPGTMPATHYKRIVYGGIVGLVLGSQFSSDIISASPHVALLIGNVFAFAVTRRTSTKMTLVKKTKLSPTTYDFAFKTEQPIAFQPGQYMELTLPGIPYNLRGNRRTFSIASAPDDQNIHIGIKFYKPSSAFKQSLLALDTAPASGQIVANHVAGDFLLPNNPLTPVTMIAGGIGITPFISMLKQMIHDDKARAVTLYYFAAEPVEVVYQDVLDQAAGLGVKIILKVGHGERLTAQEIAAIKQSHIYISGPPGLVSAYKAQLKQSGATTIRTDYFTGY